MKKTQIFYLVDQILGRFDFSRYICPNCGSKRYHVADKKALSISLLLVCNNCGIQYRAPTPVSDRERFFYRFLYDQGGLITELPSRESLRALLSRGFTGTDCDLSHICDVVDMLKPFIGDSFSLLDYGANWGYGAWQYSQRFPKAYISAYEIGDERRKYGEDMLGVRYLGSDQLRDGQFDIILSTHVIEHMPIPSLFLQECCRALRKGGWLIIECPNGSLPARLKISFWSCLWGRLHPYFISDSYLACASKGLFGSLTTEAVYPLSRGVKNLVNLLAGDMEESLSTLPSSPNLLFIGKKC